jgi:hypothetical protein
MKQPINEIRRMQKLAGILKEDSKIDKKGNIIYDLYDENSEWDFSDSDTFMITWVLDKDVSNKRVQRKFEWDDENFNIEIPINNIKSFLEDPTISEKNFEVNNGFLPLNKQQAQTIMDDYYENWPDVINPKLN